MPKRNYAIEELEREREREREKLWCTWAELERGRKNMDQPVNLTATVGGSALLLKPQIFFYIFITGIKFNFISIIIGNVQINLF